ncbi:hypothetical protein [Nonomuraea longicatena]|uniref:Integral membrane protein n=1 Tax=Nonomuraea longicatena TaxID=83682 RepID=A0ABP4B100_9ACTN
MSFGRNSLPAIVTVLIVAGFWLYGAALVTRVGHLAVPSAVGLPYGLPGGSALPGTLGALTELLAGLVLVAVVASTRRGFWTTWGAFALGAALANLPRSALPAHSAEAGPGTYGLLLAGGLVAGLLWGAALGWTAGLAALPRRREGDRSRAGIDSRG